MKNEKLGIKNTAINIKLWLIFLLFLLAISSTASAQQQAGQTAPETRNPQVSQPELFSQQGDVQSTGSNDLLRQGGSIRIPDGKPAEFEDSPDENWIGIGGWFVLFGSIVAAGTLWLVSKDFDDSKQKLAQTDNEKPLPPIKTKKATKKNSSTKNKKSGSKKSKKSKKTKK